MMFFVHQRIKIFYPSLILLLSLLVYIFFAGRLKFVFPTSIYNYFSYLAEAFSHGSLAFISNPPNLHDLTTAYGKIYMYWGAGPVLLVLPFVILFGKNISDVLYTSIIASFNPLFIYLLLHQIQRLKIIKLSEYQKILLCIFFAFGTIHFYLSIFGTVWFTSQIISISYLLICLLSITKFSETNNFKTLILSSIFFSLAVNSRTTLIFYLPIVLFFLSIPYLKNKDRFKRLLTPSLIFGLILIISILLSCLYNYVRFSSFFENGYIHNRYDIHFADSQQKYGFFNKAYIPRNFYYMFINPPILSSKFPFFSFDPEGNSILFISPLLFLIILIVKRKYWNDTNLKLLNFSSFLCSFLIIFFLLQFSSNGWLQFGYRYLLDLIPIFILFLAEVITEVPIRLTIILLIISIFMNLLGSLWFFKFFVPAF